jgi:tight adherence protein B
MTLLSNLIGDYFFLFVVLAFAATVLLLEGLYLLWNAHKSPEAKKIEQRLRVLAAGTAANGETTVLKQRLLNEAETLQKLLLAVPRLRQLDRMVEQSGLQLTISRLLLITLAIAIGSYLLALVMLPAALAALLALVAASVPILYVRRRRTQRMRKLERQLPDALDLIGRALRAGHAFATGLKMAGDELAEPLGGEFRLTHEEINFGVSLPQALMNMAARTTSTDLRYFVVAVLTQRETGGNLTEVLGNLATLMRERFKLLEKVRVLASEGKLSAWILCLLPFVVAGAISVINPAFMRVLWTDSMGLKMVGTALGMMLLGALWMRRIIRIHV